MTLWFAVAAIFLLVLLMLRRKPVEHRGVNQLPPPNEEVLALIDHHTQLRVRPQ